MKSLVFREFGEPAEVLQLEETPEPTAAAGEVVVRMLAAPVNPSDLMTIRGIYGKLPELPATPGFEGVGIVESGKGAYAKFLKGKRVAVLNGTTGNWQDKTVISAKQAVPLAKNLTVEQSAMFFVNPATAYIMTRQVLAIPTGEWLLQSAAASALGRMVIRLGQHFGFKTISVVRREQQAEDLRQLGTNAAIAFDPEKDPADKLQDMVKTLTNDQGIRFAIDPVGGATASAMVDCLAPGARMLLFGTLCDQPIAFSPRTIMTAGASIEGFWLARWMQQQKLFSKIRLMKQITKLIQQKVLISGVGDCFPLEQYAEAMLASEQPGRDGKVLLRISDAG